MNSRLQVEFRITGTQVSAEEISSRVGILPTRTWNVGDPIQKTKLKRKHNGWCLTASDKITDVNEAMLSLLNTLLPKRKYINDLRKEHNLDCEMSSVIYISNQIPEINLSKETIFGLAELSAEVDIDVIFWGKGNG